MRLRSKLTSEICQKVRSLDGKVKWIKTPTLLFLSQKITAFKEK